MSVDTTETSFEDWIAQQDADLAARGLTRPTKMSAEDEAIFRELMGDAAVDEALAKEAAARAAKEGAS